MPKTVDQIRQQIAKLKEQEQALMQKEVSGVVARIREAVAHYGLTADQIFGAAEPAKAGRKPGRPKGATVSGRKPRAAKSVRGVKRASEGHSSVDAEMATRTRGPSPAKGTKIAAKYKDEAGNSWSGRGSQPRWLRAALEGGKKLEDFAVA